ncbi:MAG: DUF6261 family protein [Prevotellaceae bacterium]|jgi:hypothetical protein|nr:DUF6261 family protein [Prevotellaceae bacterium]
MDTLKIERFRFDGLKNVEFTLVVPHIVNILEKYPVIEQQLKNRLDALKGFLPDLDRIEAQERKWNKAGLLNEAERARDAYVNTLIRAERTFARIDASEYREASGKLTALFDKHKRDIADDRNVAETQRIYDLIEDVERTDGMINALTALALLPAYNAMKEANMRFDELWQQRNAELGTIERVDSKAIRSDCVKAVNAMYEGIEYWASESENQEWKTLISELSRLGSYYKQQIKARTTRRRNKENTGNEPPIKPKID